MSKVKNAVNTALTKGPDHIEPAEVDKENIDKHLLNKTWEDMDKLYDDLTVMLANNSEGFKTLMDMSNNELKDYVNENEKAELGILYQSYVRDLDAICNDMIKVKKSYEKFTSKPKNEKETLLSISVLESYLSIYEKVQAIVPPTSIRLAEIVGEAVNRRDGKLETTGENNDE
jgi:hypothetical protein